MLEVAWEGRRTRSEKEEHTRDGKDRFAIDSSLVITILPSLTQLLSEYKEHNTLDTLLWASHQYSAKDNHCF